MQDRVGECRGFSRILLQLFSLKFLESWKYLLIFQLPFSFLFNNSAVHQLIPFPKHFEALETISCHVVIYRDSLNEERLLFPCRYMHHLQSGFIIFCTVSTPVGECLCNALMSLHLHALNSWQNHIHWNKGFISRTEMLNLGNCWKK